MARMHYRYMVVITVAPVPARGLDKGVWLSGRPDARHFVRSPWGLAVADVQQSSWAWIA
jgi:hypothetical protein